MFSNPFSYAALSSEQGEKPRGNVIPVGASSRSGARAQFSNRQGCILAMGEGVLMPGGTGYWVGEGTSFAAPQVAAAIALLLAYEPSLTIARTLELLGVPAPDQRPQGCSDAKPLDSFNALLLARKDSLRDLADMKPDGHIDMGDFQVFRQLVLDAPNDTRARWYSRADLNGSGEVSLAPSDHTLVLGKSLGDLDILVSQWEDKTVSPADLPALLKEGAQQENEE